METGTFQPVLGLVSMAAVVLLVKGISTQLVPDLPAAPPEPSTSQFGPPFGPTSGVETPQGSAVIPAPAVPQSKTVSSRVSYDSPAGPELMGFHLVVDGAGVIKSVRTDILADAPTSIYCQQIFARSLPSAVVGKKLASLGPVDRVAGSSLTTDAFNQAIADLKSQL